MESPALVVRGGKHTMAFIRELIVQMNESHFYCVLMGPSPRTNCTERQRKELCYQVIHVFTIYF